ncbi:MAG: L,D-transpeptidase family protein [Hyphomicrobiales bacterium]|nr:L,D-transpeptidase family protein [Hyphomicrobiales bacterium]
MTVTLPKPAHASVIHLHYTTPAPQPAASTPTAPAPAPPVAAALVAAPPPVAVPAADPQIVAALAALPSLHHPLGRVLLAHTYGNFREAVSQQYEADGQQPMFLASAAGQPPQWSAAARSLAQRLTLASHDGIDLGQTPVPDMNGAADGAADVALTAAVLNYAWQAQGGRVNPRFISHFVELRPTIVPPGDVLARLMAAKGEAGTDLQHFNPQQSGYQRLRHDLIARLAQRPDGQGEALKSWRAARNGLVVNMEFWRWQQAPIGAAQIVVNVPAFTLRLRKDGHTVMTRKVIVGKSATPTPLLNSKIKYIIINPSWHVPQSIIKKDFLPKLEANPNYLTNHGFAVRTVDGHLVVKQPPGPRNALGLIKFIFPNDQSVYLHDTSERHLFSNRVRAFSHGCVRLQEPFSLASALLGAKWSQKRLESMVGSKEHYLRFGELVPIQIEYFTIYAEGDGKLEQFADLYGYARKVQAALGLRT